MEGLGNLLSQTCFEKLVPLTQIKDYDHLTKISNHKFNNLRDSKFEQHQQKKSDKKLFNIKVN